MWPSLLALAVLVAGTASPTTPTTAATTVTPAAEDPFDYQISDELYYQLPALFHLDDYDACLSQQAAVYCVGSFHLAPATDTPHNHLFEIMERYSVNWVDRFNHTRLHRGLCVSRRCPSTSTTSTTSTSDHHMKDRFSQCVNESLVERYSLTARLYQLDYCRGPHLPTATAAPAVPADTPDRVFAAVLAALLALALLSTTLDVILTEQGKKGLSWALCWSVPRNWRSLTAQAPASSEPGTLGDLRVCDGLRAMSMLCVVVEHVCWISTTTYQINPRFTETTRRNIEALLLTNSTLLVQVFFLLSSFLLAHKLLQDSRRGPLPTSAFLSTMLTRVVRISPVYWFVVGFAATWWPHLGSGPMWTPLVEAEAAVCRRKWWAQFSYLNNIIQRDDKCLIQTWYLAADMQLYACALALTLALSRWRRAAVPLLSALMALAVGAQFIIAYLWRLQPTFITHNPEAVRATYAGDASFNWLYQSPLGNVPGCLAGLLLAHIHHDMLDGDVRLQDYKCVALFSRCAAPLAALWVLLSPMVLGKGRPARLAAAALAALDRPVFATLVALALLGAFHDIHTPWRRWLSWRGWTLPARLSFCVLLLHMPLNKALVASRLHATQVTHLNVIYEWGAVCVLSYLAALPLALVVELPAVRMRRALAPAPATPAPLTPATPDKPPHNN